MGPMCPIRLLLWVLFVPTDIHVTDESPDDEEELEDPYHNSGSSDEDYYLTENDIEDSSQSGEKSDVPNMNSNTNDLKDNNETNSNSGESNSSTGIRASDESEEDEQVFRFCQVAEQIRLSNSWNTYEEQEKCTRIFRKLNRGDSQFRVNNEGTIVCRWQDTKDALPISNCFSDTTTEVKRTMKDGTRKDVLCPAMLQFCNANMGVVDLTDQIAGLYDFDRKSGKWWKKVYYTLLMVAVANAHILYNDLHRTKTPLLLFLIQVAEGLV
ncbi:hypothetical protein ILUMI_21727 [Ignelater luminosus]|uniref:PiggyBac transposable element-derived protein domain-containing protein n=1 Tax=Ignelater luminosus TaxID=2038154 RepID=A0A8K0CFQ5_IGNLU|nr:hypothetical protein ILUMI_21727 [Ignelater luminosus]